MIKLITYVDPKAVCDELIPTCRMSSSISSTFANSDLDDRSFNSNSFIRLDNKIVLRVIFLPGRDIRNNHGNHCKNTDFIWRKEKKKKKKTKISTRKGKNCLGNRPNR